MEHTISILRFQFGANFTKSLVHVDGKFFCYCLEPEVIKGTPVVGKRDAIPCGKYLVQYTLSPRMKKYTLELQNVPYNSGIRIHVGNKPNDTMGCLLMGMQSYGSEVGSSCQAVGSLELAISQWLAKGDKVWCVVSELSYDEQLSIRP